MSNQHLLPKVRRTLLALSALAVASSAASAQSYFYVDPTSGNDNNAGTLQSPLATIGAAMTAAGAAAPAVVVLHPGIYASPAESYPILVPEDVSIQGTNALNTVLAVNDRNLDGLEFATTPHEGCFVDSIMITGADEAIRVSAVADPESVVSSSVSPTISNCVMMNNIFGFSAVTDTFVEAAYGVSHQARLVNCTMTGNFYGAVDWFINEVLDGPSDLALVNCLVIGNSFDIEGIDADDVDRLVYESVGSGNFALTPNAPTSALPTAGFSIDTTFIDAEDFNGDPFFADSYDFRLDPTDAFALSLIDQGTLAQSVPNGTSFAVVGPGRMFARDYDAEGFGNPRRRGGVLDIGADEIGTLIVSGYVPQTTMIDPAVNVPSLFFNAGAPGTPIAVGGFGRQSAPIDWLTTLLFGGTPGGGPGLVVGGAAGLRAVGTTIGLPFVGVSGTRYAQMQNGFMSNTPLFSTGMILTGGPTTISIQPPTLIAPEAQFDMQLTFGQIVNGQIPNPIFTNLQSFQAR